MAILEREDHGAVQRLAQNRPEALTALSSDMRGALEAAFAGLANDPAVRAVLPAPAGACAYTGAVIAATMMKEGTAEGIRAFPDKPKPNWPQ